MSSHNASFLNCFAEDGAFHYRLRLVGGVPNALCLVADNLGIGVGPAHIALNGVLAHLRIVDGMHATLLPVWVYAIEQQVYIRELMQCAENVNR